MENHIKGVRSAAFGIFLSSAVMAALITSIFSYQASRETNRYLIDIEMMKRESELTTFRYLKIYNAIEEISSLPSVDYTYIKIESGKSVQDKELFKTVVQQATERYDSVIKIFKRVKPLMDELFLSPVALAIAEENRQSSVLTRALYTNQPLPEGVDTVTLLEARRKVETSITEALGLQVSSLTKATSILKSR
jgi:hypothetical protein